MWPFLSSLAQDFIEELDPSATTVAAWEFLSSLAQDFIEEEDHRGVRRRQDQRIPELSSSGLH